MLFLLCVCVCDILTPTGIVPQVPLYQQSGELVAALLPTGIAGIHTLPPPTGILPQVSLYQQSGELVAALLRWEPVPLPVLWLAGITRCPPIGIVPQVPLYQQSGALVAALLRWEPTARTLPGRFEELYVHMYELGIIGLSDVRLAQAWLSDLCRLGYNFPQLLRAKQ